MWVDTKLLILILVWFIFSLKILNTSIFIGVIIYSIKNFKITRVYKYPN